MIIVSTEMLSHFIAMGGYASYVWPAYGIVAVGLIYLAAATKKQQQRSNAKIIKYIRKNTKNS